MIVSHERKDILRSHHDLDKDTCRYTKKAAKVSEWPCVMNIHHWCCLCDSSMKVWQRGQLKMDMQLTSTAVPWIRQASMK